MNIDELLKRTVEKDSSDLHLTVASPPVMRINGVLSQVEEIPALRASDIINVFDQISNHNQKLIFQKDQELDFAYPIPGLARFRVNVMQQRGSMSMAFRRIPFEVPTIDQLELPQICKELVLKPRGLILITGSAGSGKSTTLAAMINHLNETEKKNIITIEDPIEFLFSNKKCIIRQRDLGDDTRSFHIALVNALRHDPDVIMIGEMRDLLTISIAVSAAETGHLVLGTLHTIDAAQSIDRIVDVFPPEQQRQVRLQLSQTLEAVLSQTLLPRKGGGRIAAFEIMLANSSIRKLIREGNISDIPAHIQMYRQDGMQTMDQAMVTLVKQDEVDINDALKKSSNPISLKKMIQGSGSYHQPSHAV